MEVRRVMGLKVQARRLDQFDSYSGEDNILDLTGTGAYGKDSYKRNLNYNYIQPAIQNLSSGKSLEQESPRSLKNYLRRA